MDVRRAIRSDARDVTLLLESVGLPTGGLREQFPAAFWIARDAGSLVGSVGLERYGTHGLLRSLAVADHARGGGVASTLVRHALDDARHAGLSAVFLLTTSAARYFPRYGFESTAREAAPEEIRRSLEFATICPASATCLVWHPTARVSSGR